MAIYVDISEKSIEKLESKNEKQADKIAFLEEDNKTLKKSKEELESRNKQQACKIENLEADNKKLKSSKEESERSYYYEDTLFPHAPNPLNAKMVLASSGVYYDKEELKQLVACNRNPICIITGKPLTERPEDFYDEDEDLI